MDVELRIAGLPIRFVLDALAFTEFDGQNGVQMQGPVAFDREESSGDHGSPRPCV